MKLGEASVLLTGAASGIGLAAYEALRAQNTQVVGIDRDRDAIDKAKAAGCEIRYCDVSQHEQIEALADELESTGRFPNVLVNNAAILRDQTLVAKLGKSIKQHSLTDWHDTLASNLTGTFLCARQLATHWIKTKSPGVIINTSSVVRVGNAGQSAYAATKAAVDSLTVTWANELSIYNIRVAAIAYGFAQTGMTERIPKMFLEQLARRAKVRRFAHVGELVHGLEFIIENEYFSGRTLELDGGMRF